MAFQRATPPALRWVALFLTGCAVLGLTLGLRDQIRRNPPAWYTGAREKPVIGSPLIQAREATPIDPLAAQRPTLQDEDVEAAPAKPKAEEPKPTETAQAATPAEKTADAATPKPKTATPSPKGDSPSDDPVGDLLEGQKKAPEPPPVVPY